MSISFYTFKENYKSISGSLTPFQAEGIKLILEAWENYNSLTDIRQLAYILATVKHETANTYRPIEEYGKGAGRAYGATVNGHRYYGRGYVQLTWKENYEKMTKRLKLLGVECDLVNNPEQALDWRIAAAIMFVGMEEGLFTGKKLKDYLKTQEKESSKKLIKLKNLKNML